VTDEETLREYIGWLRKTAGNMIGFGDPGLDDLVQEGYIAMWRALKNFDRSKGSLPSWLTAKAHWRMLEVVQRTKRTIEVTLDEAPEDQLAAPDLLDAIDIAYHDGEIAQAVSELTTQQRRYVIARFWLGLSGKEMVELGVFSYDPSALWTSRKNGARWKLQNSLQHLMIR
jgi:RNA polymerase sigma factor (sigma-70 family)